MYLIINYDYYDNHFLYLWFISPWGYVWIVQPKIILVDVISIIILKYFNSVNKILKLSYNFLIFTNNLNEFNFTDLKKKFI